MAMLKWIGGLMDRAFAVLGAILFAQAPLFMQQYTQQLIGREAELKLQVDAMRNAAAISGKTLEAFIRKFAESGDIDFSSQGEAMQAMVGRWHQLSDALAAMQNSTMWGRPFAFIYHLNGDAFGSTLTNFHAGLPINLEGGAYALVGIVFGYFVFATLRKIVKGFFGLFTKFKEKPAS
jgi:hypothetical protein